MSLTNGLAPRPPMGWNSYDCYGAGVMEHEVKATAEAMQRRLARFGWQYVVVDIRWCDPRTGIEGYDQAAEPVIDAYGRVMPAENRFPSAAGGNGFKPLADYVHGLGLKFGIHIMRGIPRRAVEANTPIFGTDARARDVADTSSECRWCQDMYGVDVGKPGGREYYGSLVDLYAAWGVDYIKADDMASPYNAPEIEAVFEALQKCGREIILSLSPGDSASTDHAAHAQAHSELWRITGDIWDSWKSILRVLDACPKWLPHQGPCHWPDADMLPLGRIGIRSHGGDRRCKLTRDEQDFLMTLWAIFRSPLMFGGDVPSLDPFTLSLLTNEEVLAVDQECVNNRQLFRRDGEAAWVADVPGTGAKYAALFNLADEETREIRVPLAQLGLGPVCTARDLWNHLELGRVERQLTAVLRPHAAVLYKLSPVTGRA